MTGIDRFDPDAFIRSAGPYEGETAPALPTMPVEWQRGMARLMELPAPLECPLDRWKQIQTDAERFMLSWAEQAQALGWSTSDLFGYDPQKAHGIVGLVIDIRGDRVVALTEEFAAIKKADGHRWHYRHMPADARAIWAFGGRL